MQPKVIANISNEAFVHSVPARVPSVIQRPEIEDLTPELIEKHEERLSLKTAGKVIGTVAGLGVINSVLGTSSLDFITAIRPYTMIPATVITGAISFYLGNHVKHTLSESKAEAAYVRKERAYETIKGALYAASFLFWPETYAWAVEHFIQPLLGSVSTLPLIRALLFHVYLGFVLTPSYSLIDSAASKILNLHDKGHEPYRRIFWENLHGAYKFFYNLPSYEGDSMGKKVRNAFLGRGGLYSVIAFTFAPLFLLPPVVCGINTFFSYFHAAHKEKGSKARLTAEPRSSVELDLAR